jgi:hypothetical protein
MRHALGGVLLTIALLGCGGGDSNEPEDPFPDVEGLYQVSGTFDDLPANQAFFDGTLTLTQASQETGDLQGSLSLLVTIDDDIFNIVDTELTPASVSPSGVIAFTAADPSGTWTFSGTASGTLITDGRHTLSAGSDNFSGPWQADATSSIRASVKRGTPRPSSFGEAMERLRAVAKEVN